MTTDTLASRPLVAAWISAAVAFEKSVDALVAVRDVERSTGRKDYRVAADAYSARDLALHLYRRAGDEVKAAFSPDDYCEATRLVLKATRRTPAA